MAVPCAIIASCSILKPEELVTQILAVDELPEGIPVVESIQAFPWHIDTKYYTANIHLCTVPDRTIGDRDFADNVQAFVLHFDTALESTFEGVQLWLPYIKELRPVIQLLVCNTCKDGDAVSKQEAWSWCLENSFELVELEPHEDSGSEEDDFMETTGIKRVVQALHAHTWPNLQLKEKPSFRSPYMQQMMQTEAANNATETTVNENQESEPPPLSPNSGAMQGSNEDVEETAREGQDSESFNQDAESSASNDLALESGGATCMAPSTQQSLVNTMDSCQDCGLDSVEAIKAAKQLENAAKKQSSSNSTAGSVGDVLTSDDLQLFAALGNEDPGGESFEQLFSRLRLMKEKAEGLPAQQRKVLAEQVAVQFWKAVGGDEEEIGGLSSSEDSD